MKETRTSEAAVKQNAKNPEEPGINATLFLAYRTSGEDENKLISPNEVIWDYDIEDILGTLRANNTTELITSSTFSSLIKTLAVLEK